MYKKNDGNTFKFTVVKKITGTVTKSIYLDDEGKIQKDLKDCYLDYGFGQVVEVTLKEFPQILRSLDKRVPQQNLWVALGVGRSPSP